MWRLLSQSATAIAHYAGKLPVHWLILLMMGLALQCGFGWFFALWMGYWLGSAIPVFGVGFAGFIVGLIIVASPEIVYSLYQDMQHGKAEGKPTTVLKAEREIDKAVNELKKSKKPGQWN